MKRLLNFLIQGILKEETWIVFAIIIFVADLMLLILHITNCFQSDMSVTEIFKEYIFPLAAGVAFCVGFSLTIKRTKAIEFQTESTQKSNELRERELEQRYTEFIEGTQQHRFIRFKEIVKSFDEGGVLTIDTLGDLVGEAKLASDRNEIETIQKIVAVLCSFIKIHSNNERCRMSKIDKDWNGNVSDGIMPSFIIQEILNQLFPIIPDMENADVDLNAKENYKENVFYKYRMHLKFDLTMCNLQNMDLSKRELYKVNFGGSAMHNAQMYKTTCTNCSFWGTYLPSVDLSCSNIDHCNFSCAKMVWAKFCGSNVIDCDFNKADMTCCLLSDTVFSNKCSFVNAVLDGSDIYRHKIVVSNKKEPSFFSKPNNLKTSLKFSFIYPVNIADDNTLVIDSSKSIYNAPLNRLQRMIIYLNILTDETNIYSSTLTYPEILGNKKVLFTICNKALKYAVIDESTKLNEKNYIEWTSEIKKKLLKVETTSSVNDN